MHLCVHINVGEPHGGALGAVPDPPRLDAERPDHDLELVVLLPEASKIRHSFLELGVVRVDLDRHELLGPLARDLARDVGELLDAVVPGLKNGTRERHGPIEGRVVHVRQSVRAEDLEKLRGEVARDGLDERERALDGVRPA